MTTRSQKRKTVAELVLEELEAFVNENSQLENLVAAPSKSPRNQAKKIDDMKTSLTKAIMSDLTNILVENQKEMIKSIAPGVKNQQSTKIEKIPTLKRKIFAFINNNAYKI